MEPPRSPEEWKLKLPGKILLPEGVEDEEEEFYANPRFVRRASLPSGTRIISKNTPAGEQAKQGCMNLFVNEFNVVTRVLIL